MIRYKKILIVAAALFLCFAILSPNPYGNNPDIVLDESYFLTSALSAIQNMRPPGWDFPLSGAYYGGPQVYVDTAAMVPVTAGVVAYAGFSLTDAKVWIALHTGELLHVLRLVNGVAALVALGYLVWYFRRRAIPRELAETLSLFALLLLSNVLVIQFLHTAKVWSFHIIFAAIATAFFVAEEYYRARFNRGFLSGRRYLALLIWLGVLTAFQTYIGAFSVLLLFLYALVLKHFSIRDALGYILRYWYLFLGFALTQISFLYRAYTISGTITNATTHTASGAIDWYARLIQPLIYSIEAQPLILLNVAALIAIVLCSQRDGSPSASRRRLYIALALLYPLFTYIVFHVIVGFDILPRYAILMTLALSTSAAMLFALVGSTLRRVAIGLAVLLCVGVGAQAIHRYWSPSSERTLLAVIETSYNTPEHVFIVDHSARRTTLPINSASLDLLDDERRAMSRFAYLIAERDRIPTSTFTPLTMIAYRDEQMSEYLKQFADPKYSVWIVSAECSHRCSAAEISAGACFEINTHACGVYPHEPNTLPVFFGAAQLGYSYIVRNIH